MSMTEYYEKWGYNVSFSHEEFTGFYKLDPTKVGIIAYTADDHYDIQILN